MTIAALKTWFAEAKGLGVMSTADAAGAPNAALFARPHFLEDGRLGFVMLSRKTLANLEANPNACFLFAKEGPGYEGVRLYLTRDEIIRDEATIETLIVSRYALNKPRVLMLFRLEKALKLASGEELF
ncbi:MAG: pyridoxamine 5'-phosphate oxidase family protein [Campylobacterales bacterium]